MSTQTDKAYDALVEALEACYPWLRHLQTCHRRPALEPDALFEGDPLDEGCTCYVAKARAALALARVEK